MHTRIPNWFIKLLHMGERLEIQVREAQDFHLHVRHDDWCARLQGRGPCNCDPDLRVLDRPPRPSGGD